MILNSLNLDNDVFKDEYPIAVWKSELSIEVHFWGVAECSSQIYWLLKF